MEKYHTNKTPRDDEYIRAYLNTQSQTKAAVMCGVSRETIARACRRAGIALNGRRNNGDHKGNGGGGSPRKISDAELIEESKTMTREEIATKHKMNICNVDRKLHRLGISCKRAEIVFTKGVKRGGKYYRRIMVAGFNAEYDSGVTLKKLVKKQGGICQICGGPVDITDRVGLRMGNKYPTIDHIKPISAGGGHTWGNVQLAHMICNSKKCDNVV